MPKSTKQKEGKAIEDLENKIKKAITKKAVGYEAEETVCEYQKEDDGLTLTKKKVTTKHYPPDTQAAKMLLDSFRERDIDRMSEEELKKEKERLILLIKGEIDEGRKL